MAEQELTSIIDNFEKKLSLLRKAIKKESVKRSTADKIVLNIYRATSRFSLKGMSEALYYVGYIKVELKNIMKETGKALKNKKLRSDGLVTMNNYFKGVIDNLNLIPNGDSINDVKDKIVNTDVPTNACPSNCYFKEGMNSLNDQYNCNWTQIKICSQKEDEKKINFISNMIKAVNCLRKACKVHLNNKRGKTHENDLSAIKNISNDLSKLREEVTDVKYDGSLGLGQFKFLNGAENNKKKIKTQSIECCKSIGKTFGGKKNYYLKKYVNKKELSAFVNACNYLSTILISLARECGVSL